ncbi:hypothetical protein LOAG_02087 [Loa loa]|uniref:Uncharacterized protein n=1 Tax=Loa loa TaxID=7209 RepID=A0A1S0U7P9_LOALO|nr:hypothetical protein LOAG_02087 [Loa loa]EFO26395.1 hypothetical protein LOAG_02087 [Loa loa]
MSFISDINNTGLLCQHAAWNAVVVHDPVNASSKCGFLYSVALLSGFIGHKQRAPTDSRKIRKLLMTQRIENQNELLACGFIHVFNGQQISYKKQRTTNHQSYEPSCRRLEIVGIAWDCNHSTSKAGNRRIVLIGIYVHDSSEKTKADSTVLSAAADFRIVQSFTHVFRSFEFFAWSGRSVFMLWLSIVAIISLSVTDTHV